MYWPEFPGESVKVTDDMTALLYCLTEDDICFQREIWLEKAGSTKRKVFSFLIIPLIGGR